MQYYSEAEMRHLRMHSEEHLLRWPGVRTKKMFGCPCYEVRGRLFAFLVTGGIVVTRLGTRDRERLCRDHKGEFFRAGKKTVSRWVKIPTQNTATVDRLIPLVKRSFDAARRRQ